MLLWQIERYTVEFLMGPIPLCVNFKHLRRQLQEWQSWTGAIAWPCQIRRKSQLTTQSYAHRAILLGCQAIVIDLARQPHSCEEPVLCCVLSVSLQVEMADSIAQSSERVKSQALDDAESLGSPIVTVVTKRIRAVKKHLTKIERIEAKALEQPDKIDKDQVNATE